MMNRILLRLSLTTLLLATATLGSSWFNRHGAAARTNCAALAFDTVALPAGTINQPYSAALESSGGVGPYQFTKLTGTLPNGVTLNVNGTFSGTPIQPGTFNLTVQTQDANGCSGAQDFSLQVNCQTITVSAPANNAGLVNAPFSAQFTQSGGSGTTTFNTTSNLPNGLTLAPSGTVSGTPTQAGSFPLTVKATAANGCLGTANYTLTINPCPASFTVNSLDDTPDAAPGNGACADANGQCTLRAALLEANAIPACAPLTINFSVTGAINPATALPALDHPNLTISGPGAQVLSIARPGNAPNFRLFFINGGKTVTLSGLTIAGGFDNNGGGLRNEGALTLRRVVIRGNGAFENGGGIRNGGTLTLTDSTLAHNSATGAFNEGGGLYNAGTATVSNTTIEANAALSGGGALTTPDSALTLTNVTIAGNTANTGGGLRNTGGAAATTLRNTIVAANANNATVPDVAGAFTSAGNNLIGNAGTATGFNAAGDQTGTGAALRDPLLAPLGDYGGTTPARTLLPGSPAINAGTVSGAPANDQRNVARPQNGAVDIGAVEASFALAATGGTPQSALLSTPFAAPLQATLTENGFPLSGVTLTFSAPGSGPSATFPNGNTATTNASGQAGVSVTANQLLGSYAVQAAAAGVASANFNLTNFCPLITLAPAILPNAVINTAYPPTLSATPALAYTFAVTSGLLPAGLVLNANGSFSGVPAQGGVFSFRVTATAFGVCGGFRDYVLLVECPALTLAPASLPGGVVGAAYNQTVSALPAGAYSYGVTGGALPAGLALNAATGVISGVPSTGGTFSFRVAATAGSCSGVRDYTVVIGCTGLSFTPPPLAAGTAGTAYAQTIGVSPAGSYNFALVAGSLPSGLTLNATTGVLSGWPSLTGSYNFTLKVTATNGCFATQDYTLTINCPSIALAALPPPALNTPYNQTLAATPAGGNYSYAVTSGALPAGLVVNSATGIVNGTPTVAGTFNFTITATGFGNCTGSRVYSGTLAGGTCPAITLSDLPSGAPGQLYSQVVTGTPSATYAYTVTAGSVPPGLTFIAAGGLLYGYPMAAGTYNFT
ncbi:MAG: putative Ig domain-containing protein, partial [Acidobacteria bacterium]|nr:putative Ig domain-containing protein [Acidobacteriota bacterium]